MQTAVWVPRIVKLGHEVVISAYYGLHGSPMLWGNITILPGYNHLYGDDIINARVRNENADLLITLMDIWVITPANIKDYNVAHWIPIDCEPLSLMDRMCLELSGATPIALTRFGERMLHNAGFDNALYVPHGIDTDNFKPVADRERLRKANDLDDRFVIGINAANKDPFRKSLSEQLIAFSRLYKKHDDAMLLIHGIAREDNGVDLMNLGKTLGITAAMKFADDYSYKTGRISPVHMRNWYSMLDLYTMCSAGEGFGLTALEAMACGLPVVVTNATAMPEIAGDAGWLIDGEPFYNPKHEAWWTKPNIGDIYDAYCEAYDMGKGYQERKAVARERALGYSADHVQSEYWEPTLKRLEENLRK